MKITYRYEKSNNHNNQYCWTGNFGCHSFKIITCDNENYEKFGNGYNVVFARIYNEKFPSFPRGLNNGFPFIKRLTISGCELRAIASDDLIGLEGLEELDLSNNHLKSLPSDLFINMRNLKTISFQSNKLEYISSQLLLPILENELKYIDFTENSKIDAVYDSKNPKAVGLQQLMDIIETQCNQPVEVDRQILNVLFKDDFAAGFFGLLSTGQYSDFTILTKGPKEFRVHKCVLAIQSSVFAAMFESNMEEQQTCKMTIPEFSAEAIEQFLKFLYTGSIQNVTNAMEIFELAAKYDVKKLKSASEEHVLQTVDTTNAFDVLALAHLHSLPVLKRKAFDVIKQMTPDIPWSDDFLEDPALISRMEVLIEADRKRKKAIDEFEAICKLTNKLNV